MKSVLLCIVAGSMTVLAADGAANPISPGQIDWSKLTPAVAVIVALGWLIAKTLPAKDKQILEVVSQSYGQVKLFTEALAAVTQQNRELIDATMTRQHDDSVLLAEALRNLTSGCAETRTRLMQPGS